MQSGLGRTYAVVDAIVIFCGDKRKKAFKCLSVTFQSCLRKVRMGGSSNFQAACSPRDRRPLVRIMKEYAVWIDLDGEASTFPTRDSLKLSSKEGRNLGVAVSRRCSRWSVLELMEHERFLRSNLHARICLA